MSLTVWNSQQHWNEIDDNAQGMPRRRMSRATTPTMPRRKSPYRQNGLWSSEVTVKCQTYPGNWKDSSHESRSSNFDTLHRVGPRRQAADDFRDYWQSDHTIQNWTTRYRRWVSIQKHWGPRIVSKEVKKREMWRLQLTTTRLYPALTRGLRTRKQTSKYRICTSILQLKRPTASATSQKNGQETENFVLVRYWSFIRKAVASWRLVTGKYARCVKTLHTARLPLFTHCRTQRRAKNVTHHATGALLPTDGENIYVTVGLNFGNNSLIIDGLSYITNRKLHTQFNN